MIRLDRVQRAVVGMASALAGATPPLVLWAPSNFPRRTADGSVVAARIVRGPLFHGNSTAQSDEPLSVSWTIVPVTGTRVGLSVTGAWWLTDVEGGDTAETVRDRILAMFTEEILPGVTITESGADAILFDADGTPGLLWRPQAIGPGAEIEVLTSEPCETTTAVTEVTVELQAYSAGRGLSALSLLSQIAGGLHSDRAIEIRSENGVSLIQKSELVDLTAIAGADWESRASMRLTLGVRSYVAFPIDSVESVELTTTVGADEYVLLSESP